MGGHGPIAAVESAPRLPGASQRRRPGVRGSVGASLRSYPADSRWLARHAACHVAYGAACYLTPASTGTGSTAGAASVCGTGGHRQEAEHQDRGGAGNQPSVIPRDRMTLSVVASHPPAVPEENEGSLRQTSGLSDETRPVSPGHGRASGQLFLEPTPCRTSPASCATGARRDSGLFGERSGRSRVRPPDGRNVFTGGQGCGSDPNGIC